MNFVEQLNLIFEEKYKYSSVQAEFSDNISEKIKKYGEKISPDDLAEDGLEDNPHITVKYGLHTNSPDEVRKLLEDEGPIELKLGKITVFPPSQDRDSEVLKISVTSPDLRRLNKKISSNLKVTDTYPEYKPHITIAYLKPGTAKKYTGDEFEGIEATIDSVVFSSAEGERTTIKLEGK